MSLQRFSAKNVQAIADRTGEPITRAWAGAGHDRLLVATRDHRHGIFNPRTGALQWSHPVAGHLSSCYVDGALQAELEPWE